MRTRYRGLYDTQTKEWLARDMFSHGVMWHCKPAKRLRYADEQYVKEESLRYRSSVMARSFYVTTKPRKLPPEAQAVIDKLKRWDKNEINWTEVQQALDAYEATQ